MLHDLWQGTRTETAGEIAAHVPAHGTVMYRASADPDWGRYPPTISFHARPETPAQGPAGQYILPGTPVEVTAELTNHGRLPAHRAKLNVSGPVSYEGVSYEGEGRATRSPARPALGRVAAVPAGRRCASSEIRPTTG